MDGSDHVVSAWVSIFDCVVSSSVIIKYKNKEGQVLNTVFSCNVEWRWVDGVWFCI